MNNALNLLQASSSEAYAPPDVELSDGLSRENPFATLFAPLTNLKADGFDVALHDPTGAQSVTNVRQDRPGSGNVLPLWFPMANDLDAAAWRYSGGDLSRYELAGELIGVEADVDPAMPPDPFVDRLMGSKRDIAVSIGNEHKTAIKFSLESIDAVATADPAVATDDILERWASLSNQRDALVSVSSNRDAIVDTRFGRQGAAILEPVTMTNALNWSADQRLERHGDMPILRVEPPLQHPDWGRAVGEQMRWLIGQRLQTAQLRLNPPELGPVEVQINMEHDQARIQFVSHQIGVREALEAAIPRLREALGEAGVQLLDVSVSQHSLPHPRHSGGHATADGDSTLLTADEAIGESTTATATHVVGYGFVDLYA